MAGKTFLYVGTYTRPAPYIEGHNGEGIYIYAFDPDTGSLTYASEMTVVDNCSFLAIDHQGRYLYATSEVWGWHEGLVSAFAINRETGELSYLNKQPAHGSITANINVEASNRYLLLVNYWDRDSVAMFPIQADGSLAPASFHVEHTEPGVAVSPARQDKSHAHCIVPDPTNQYAMVADLGLDKVMIYKMDLDNGKLVPNDPPFVKLNPGAGPRHFTFHPNGKLAYVIEELSSTITALAFDSATGALEIIETVSALPDGYNGESHCSELRVTQSGKFLYGANRGHDSLGIFSIDAETGKLTLAGHQLTGGRTPRNFTIDPTDQYVLVGNQDSDTIVTFRIDQSTGALEQVSVTDAPTPVCLRMLAIS